MKKKVDWDKAKIEKTTDHDGRVVSKVIYSDEKKMCKDCEHLYKERRFTRCEFYPRKFWRVNQRACVEFVLENR